MVTSQNSDSCNTTFSIKTPTATKPSEDTNNLTTPNMNIVTKLSMNKQDSSHQTNEHVNLPSITNKKFCIDGLTVYCDEFTIKKLL